MATGSYRTIEGEACGEVVEKRSRFIARLRHVESEEEALAFIAEVKAENRTARHNVYAYVLRNGRVRYTDDGEPSGTAGMPVLETLQHSDLQDVACVVTRYFGGVLLGTGGLVRAYTQAAQAAVAEAAVMDIATCMDVTLTVPYSVYEQVMRLVAVQDAQVLSTDFADVVRIGVRLLAGTEGPLVEALTELLRSADGIVIGEPHLAPFAIAAGCDGAV